jgi:hypothetical protein
LQKRLEKQNLESKNKKQTKQLQTLKPIPKIKDNKFSVTKKIKTNPLKLNKWAQQNRVKDEILKRKLTSCVTQLVVSEGVEKERTRQVEDSAITENS